MSTSLYIQCILMFMCGQALHLFWIKIPSLKDKAKANNKAYYFKEFWNCDWNIIIGTQIVLIMLLTGYSELVGWKPGIVDVVKWTFAAIGAFAGTVGLAKFSRYEQSLMKDLSVKANITEVMMGPTNSVKETIEKGKELTGQDVTNNGK